MGVHPLQYLYILSYLLLVIHNRFIISFLHPPPIHFSTHFRGNPSNHISLFYQLCQHMAFECDEINPKLVYGIQVELLLRFQKQVLRILSSFSLGRGGVALQVVQHHGLTGLERDLTGWTHSLCALQRHCFLQGCLTRIH